MVYTIKYCVPRLHLMLLVLKKKYRVLGEISKKFLAMRFESSPQGGPEEGDVAAMPSRGRIDINLNAILTSCYDSESNASESNGAGNSKQSSFRNTSVSGKPNLRSNFRHVCF